MVKKMRFYTEKHEWVVDDGFIGISDYAQEEIGDVVFVDYVCSEGDRIKKGDEIVIVESVKTVSEIYSPVDGVVKRLNVKLKESPDLINESPYEEGWMIKVDIENKEDLMNEDEYQEFIEG